MFDSNNLKKLFTSRQKIDYVESNDYPIFKIDGKQYYVDLKNSRLALRAKNYLKTLDTNENGIVIATKIKRTYSIPSLDKYLRLTIFITCELVDDDHYDITHLGVEKAVILNAAHGVIEPETVEELK